jgi:hypothetical protein
VGVCFRREFFDGILKTENDFSASFFQLLKKDFLGKACWKIKVTVIIAVVKDILKSTGLDYFLFQVFVITPTNNGDVQILFESLFVQHVSTLNLVLYRY